MTHHRTSWTTKHIKAQTFESMEEAFKAISAQLGSQRAAMCHIGWSSSQHAFVVHNEPGTKMLAGG